MPTAKRPRFGSLQFYPRKRVRKFLPSVNWKPVLDKQSEDGLSGFIAYKVGMSTALIKDNTDKSMTKGKRVSIPVTILEVPNMKVFSVRFYKKGIVSNEVVVSNDKELKRKLKVPKTLKKPEDIDKIGDFDDVRVIVYSNVKQTGIKKTPDLIELALKSSDKKAFVKELIGKEIILQDFLKGKLFDVRGLTKGKGLQGPVRRFGITLKRSKSEKGRRNPGSIGPWHPAHVTFRVPMSGQLGTFTRVHYNLNLVDFGNITEKDINPKSGFKHYGKIKGNYIILKGSVQGPKKRQIVVTPALRPNKKQGKKDFEFVRLEK